MNKHIFITGIDTDCGKTYITGLLAKKLRTQGINSITSKLVQTGCEIISEDIEEHRRIMQIELLEEDKNGTTCPFVYTFPASPHLAANIDKRPFDINKVNQTINILKKKYDIVLTEGAGGIYVPLTDQFFTSDYLRQNKIPVILVSSSKLGSLNHTLLSIDFCKNNNINLIAIIYNQFPNTDSKIAKSSYTFIKNYLNRKYPEIKTIHSNDLQEGKTAIII